MSISNYKEIQLCLKSFENRVYNKDNYKILINEYSKCIVCLCTLENLSSIKSNEIYIKDYLMKIKYFLYNFDNFDMFSFKYGYPLCIYTINHINKYTKIGDNIAKCLHKLICENATLTLGYYNFSRVSDLKLDYSIEGKILSILLYFLDYNKGSSGYYVENSIDSIKNTILRDIDVYGFRVPGWYKKSVDYEYGFFDNSIDNGILGLLISLCVYTNIYGNNTKIENSIFYIISYIFKSCIVSEKNKEFIYKSKISLEDYLLNTSQEECEDKIQYKIDLIISLYISGRFINNSSLIDKSLQIYDEIIKYIDLEETKLKYPKLILFQRKILLDTNQSDENLKNKYNLIYLKHKKIDINIFFSINCNFESDIDFIKFILLY